MIPGPSYNAPSKLRYAGKVDGSDPNAITTTGTIKTTLSVDDYEYYYDRFDSIYRQYYQIIPDPTTSDISDFMVRFYAASTTLEIPDDGWTYLVVSGAEYVFCNGSDQSVDKDRCDGWFDNIGNTHPTSDYFVATGSSFTTTSYGYPYKLPASTSVVVDSEHVSEVTIWKVPIYEDDLNHVPDTLGTQKIPPTGSEILKWWKPRNQSSNPISRAHRTSELEDIGLAVTNADTIESVSNVFTGAPHLKDCTLELDQEQANSSYGNSGPRIVPNTTSNKQDRYFCHAQIGQTQDNRQEFSEIMNRLRKLHDPNQGATEASREQLFHFTNYWIPAIEQLCVDTDEKYKDEYLPYGSGHDAPNYFRSYNSTPSYYTRVPFAKKEIALPIRTVIHNANWGPSGWNVYGGRPETTAYEHTTAASPFTESELENSASFITALSTKITETVDQGESVDIYTDQRTVYGSINKDEHRVGCLLGSAFRFPPSTR